MKNLTIIAGHVFPQSSPTGKVALQFAEILKEKFQVSIIFIQSGDETYNGSVKQGLKLYSIFSPRLWLERTFEKCASQRTAPCSIRLFQFATNIVKFSGRLGAWFLPVRPKSYWLWPDNLIWYYSKAYKQLEKNNSLENIDTLLTINSPFPAHLAGRKFKKKYPHVRWLTFTIDPFARASDFSKQWLFRSLKARVDTAEEKGVFKTADLNFVSEEVYETDTEIFSEVIDKVIPIPYLLNKPEPTVGESMFAQGKINLVYAGRFYRSIRNPEYFLRIFCSMENPDITLHLFTFSDCDDLIDKYVSLSSGRIIRHAPVTTEQIPDILNQANILVSVGNSTTSFKPSKLFEYLATGKPILHINQSNQHDEVLEKYPLCIQVYPGNISETDTALEIQQFCKAHVHKQLPWESVNTLFPQHSLENIRNTILSNA
jgi:glycosyltransferase involved in cell wall biosynthesis